MISRYEAYMDGIALSSIEPALYIRDIQDGDPSFNFRQESIANKDGAIYRGKSLDKASVTISFDLRIYNPVKRRAALAHVLRWAKGKRLSINDRPGQYLRCILERFPSIRSVHRWTDTFTMTFSAYGIPYWQNTNNTVAMLTGTNTNGDYLVPGTADEAFVNVEVTANANVSTFTVRCGETSITLSGLSLTNGSRVSFSYDENGFLSIKQGNTSLMSKRTGNSSDNLVAKCGSTNRIGISSSGTISAAYSARGCWL